MEITVAVRVVHFVDEIKHCVYGTRATRLTLTKIIKFEVIKTF